MVHVAPLILLAALAGASPRGLVVQVVDPDGRLHGTPALTVTDARGRAVDVALGDGGVPPDVRAGDGRWSGAGSDLEGPYALRLADAAGGVWTASLASADPDEPSLSVEPSTDGALVASLSAPAAGPPVPAGGDGRPVPPRAATRSSIGTGLGDAGWVPLAAAWAGALAIFAWSATRRPTRTSAPSSLPGVRQLLPGAGVVLARGDADALVARLALTHRVVLAGAPPSRPVHDGAVFPLGRGRAAVEDVVAALRALEGTGPPLVVVATARLEAAGGLRGDAALERLARALPPGVNAYVFGAGKAAYEADRDGLLAEV